MKNKYCNEPDGKNNLLKKNKSFKDLSVLDIENAIRPYYTDLYPSLLQRIAKETSLSSMATNYYKKLHPEDNANKLDIGKNDKITDQNACLDAYNNLMIQAIGVVIGLTGIPDSVASSVAKKITDEIGEDALNALSQIILDMTSSEGLFDRATAFATLVVDAANIISVPTFVSMVLHSLDFWQYVEYATVASAQLFVWLGSDIFALIGELVAEVVAVNNLVQQAEATISACNL